jgi:hypothetical protein
VHQKSRNICGFYFFYTDKTKKRIRSKTEVNGAPVERQSCFVSEAAAESEFLKVHQKKP